jgi:hypothetical protein
MLNDEFSEELLYKLAYALQGSDVIPQYVFNVIEPVIEKHAAQQSVQADLKPAAAVKVKRIVASNH